MAFQLKNIIFKLFGKYEKVVDSYKNSVGKGLYERYMENLADEYDTYTAAAINGLIDNLLVPETMLVKFIPYAEAQIGAPYITDDFSIRRKLLRFLIRVYQIKGTKKSYETMFRMLGFTVDFFITTAEALNFNNYYSVVSVSKTGTAVIFDGVNTITLTVGNKYYVQNNVTELTSLTGDAYLKRETIIDFFKSNYTFDAGNLSGGGTETINPTFDYPGRTFDMKCATCSGYIIRLFGTAPIDNVLHNAVFRIIDFCEPINADLIAVFYNDVILLADDSISVWIDENGDLNYENSAVPEVSLSLSEDGDLIADNVTIGSYEIDENGDLQFIN